MKLHQFHLPFCLYAQERLNCHYNSDATPLFCTGELPAEAKGVRGGRSHAAAQAEAAAGVGGAAGVVGIGGGGGRFGLRD